MGAKSTIGISRNQALHHIYTLLDSASDEAVAAVLETLNDYCPAGESPLGTHNFCIVSEEKSEL